MTQRHGNWDAAVWMKVCWRFRKSNVQNNAMQDDASEGTYRCPRSFQVCPVGTRRIQCPWDEDKGGRETMDSGHAKQPRENSGTRCQIDDELSDESRANDSEQQYARIANTTFNVSRD